MKKDFLEPKMDVVQYEVEDVITASAGDDGEIELPDDEV